jgi:hypothetical protein
VKNICILLVILLAFDSFALADQTPQAHETTQIEKVKEQVQKRGIGEKSHVKVTLVKGGDVKGYISKVDEASFAVTDKATGQIVAISYADVRNVQEPGLSRGAKIGITAAVVVGALVVVVVIINAKFNKALKNGSL